MQQTEMYVWLNWLPKHTGLPQCIGNKLLCDTCNCKKVSKFLAIFVIKLAYYNNDIIQLDEKNLQNTHTSVHIDYYIQKLSYNA